MKIIIVLLVAVVVFLIMLGLKLGVRRLVINYPRIYIIEGIRATVATISWFGFAFWVARFLLVDMFYYRYLVYTLILIIAAFISWYFIKDVFAGLAFRARHKTGTHVRSGDLTGQIKSQHNTYFVILKGDGGLIRIPYSKAINKIFTEIPSPGILEELKFRVRVDLSAGNVNIAEASIRSAILNTPWANLKKEPEIKFMKEDDKGFHFEISHHSMSKKQMQYIKAALNSNQSIHLAD